MRFEHHDLPFASSSTPSVPKSTALISKKTKDFETEGVLIKAQLTTVHEYFENRRVDSTS